jgi:antitoxin (DNA-binding transcriptional repressor) of toxin-antitoxin stability system
VTDRGEPVAEIRPIMLARTVGDTARLDHLVALGHLSRGTRAPLPPFRPIRHQGRPLADAVAEGREDRF